MIVVTMTSWTKRINNVKPVVESVMKNTVQPDRVYLNLSKTEFEGIDLPEDLVKYFDSDDRLIINWVDEENTKTMKKVFPILQYLDDDDIIIYTDDDILFPKDLIESRLKEFENGNNPITGVINRYEHMLYGLKLSSACSIIKKCMLNGWENFCSDEVIHTYEDDHVYTVICFMNGYLYKTANKYPVYKLVRDYSQTKEFTSKETGLYSPEKTDPILEKRYNEFLGKNLKNDIYERDKR